MLAALWKSDLRHYMIVVNIVAFTALVVYLVVAVLSPRRSRDETKTPANLTPFLADEDLEGRRLERVLGWSLLFAGIVAIALPIYWLREPSREKESVHYFDKNSVHRGAVLFARPGTPDYDAATSLQCANCHGDKGDGGTAKFSINGESVAWKAPPLNTELLRFSTAEVTEIITYGRPGTPMQAWGVEGGGPKNDQAIADLVAFIQSIQLTPQQQQKQVAGWLKAANDPNATSCPEYMTCPAMAVKSAQADVSAKTKALADARTAAQKALASPGATDSALDDRCTTIKNQVDAAKGPNAPGVDRGQATACGTYLDAADALKSSRAALTWAREWERRRANVSQGQVLFELNCARCHTAGWSVFDPTAPPGSAGSVDILGLPGGGGGVGGGIGFNLRDGDVMRRFGTDVAGGFAAQVDFVSTGSELDKLYGNNGVGTGHMPGFAQMLTADEIKQIVSFERYCLDDATYTAVEPACPAGNGTTSLTPPSTTTTTAAAGGG